MPLKRSGAAGKVWREFQTVFSEFAGISIQAFDAKGAAILPAPPLPSLCSYLHRQPETLAACQKDCFRKAVTCRDSRRTLSARCYAGLSYRVVPIRRLGTPHGVIIVGRVLTEVLGEEQRRGFIGRYKLSPKAFLESHAGLAVARFRRTRSGGGVRAHAGGFHSWRRAPAWSSATASSTCRGDLLDIARKATAFEDRGPACERSLLESLVRALGGVGGGPPPPGEARRRQRGAGLGRTR